MEDWPHQKYGVDRTKELLEADADAICVTSPTGGGKTTMMRRLIEMGHPTVVIADRTMLFEQLAKGLDDHGLPYGIVAAGYAPSVFDNVQLAMLQTLDSQMRRKIMPPEAMVVIRDEAHQDTGDRANRIFDYYRERGAKIVGFTATPIGIGHLYRDLVVAGRTSDLRECGALVPARTYAPDEPDIRAMKTTTAGILQFKDECKEVMLKVVFGRVIEHYFKLNPDRRPAAIFAPGVPESKWFCEQFNKAGVPWSHIDAESIIINGEEMECNKENRIRLAEASRSGLTKGVSNRFVLRAGIDWPWLYHLIFACTYGDLSGYLQSGGRGLRQHYVDGVPQLDHIIVQDHGGNFHRHDSLNVDREWSLDDTEKSIKEKRQNALREKTEKEPIVCPKCAKVRAEGARCPACGHAYEGRKRFVIQTDGTLKEVRGDIYKPRVVNTSPDAHKVWKACVFRCKAAGMNFNQARGLFLKQTGTVPGPDFPLMPTISGDWPLPVRDVPYDRLTK